MAGREVGGMFDTLTRAIQGNFDHMMGVIKALAKNYNILVDDVRALSERVDSGAADGADGAPGAPGATGATGAAGAAGATGPAGTSGLPGFPGVDGEDGASFPVPGPAGAAGAAGATGDPGATGSAGPAGVPGFRGEDGEDGFSVVGPTGATGSQGAQGDPGATGATGQTGVPGFRGDDGDDGFSVVGPTGAAGAQGTTGDTGATGATGAPGLGWQGDDGDTGVGFVGRDGATGATGATGPSEPWLIPTDETITTDTNITDYALGSTTTRLIWDGTVATSFNGITGGADGRVLFITNNDSALTLTIKTNSATEGTASRRFICPGDADFPLGPRESCVVVYDDTSNRWRVIGRVSGTLGAPVSLPDDITVSLASATTTNDWAPAGFATASIIRVSDDDLPTTTVAGMGGGSDGRLVLIENVGVSGVNGPIAFTHEAGTSTSTKRFHLPGELTLTLQIGMSAWFWYDSTDTRWRASQATIVQATAGADITVDATGATGTASGIAPTTGHGHKLATYSSAAATDGQGAAGNSGDAPSRGTHVHPALNLYVNDPGSFSVTTTGLADLISRLTLSDAYRATLAGAGRAAISDRPLDPSVLKFRAPGSASVFPDEYIVDFDRTDLRGTSRRTLVGNARVIIENVTPTPSRLVLAGRG